MLTNETLPAGEAGVLDDQRESLGVGEGGFEPPTSCTQSRCATELRYSPCCRRLSEQVKRSANGQVTMHPVAVRAAQTKLRFIHWNVSGRTWQSLDRDRSGQDT